MALDAQRLQIRWAVIGLNAVDMMYVEKVEGISHIQATALARKILSLSVASCHFPPVSGVLPVEFAGAAARHVREEGFVLVEECFQIESCDCSLMWRAQRCADITSIIGLSPTTVLVRLSPEVKSASSTMTVILTMDVSISASALMSRAPFPDARCSRSSLPSGGKAPIVHLDRTA